MKTLLSCQLAASPTLPLFLSLYSFFPWWNYFAWVWKCLRMVLICTAIFREHFPLLKPNRTTVFYEGCWAACGWTRNQEPRYYILSQSITCHHVTIMGNWELHPVLCNHICVLKFLLCFYWRNTCWGKYVLFYKSMSLVNETSHLA